jgi:hypothetical protein
MMSGTSAGVRAADKTSSGEQGRRRLTALAVPLAALALAVIAIIAAYVVSQATAPGRPRPVATAAALREASRALAVDGAFPAERGPDGAAWQWIGDRASIRLRHIGKPWITFRALSLRLGRTLTFSGPAGKRVAVHIGTQPEVYLVGPLSEGRFLVSPTPPSSTASARDRRRLSVFLSTPQVVASPVIASPGAGFWSSESSGGALFNWLRSTGVIAVDAPLARVRSVWLTFVTRSLGQQRTLTARSGGTTDEVVVATSGRPVKLGPFQLLHGRANILVSVSPGPRRYGVDPRLLSIQVASLAAHTSAAES